MDADVCTLLVLSNISVLNVSTWFLLVFTISVMVHIYNQHLFLTSLKY